MFFIYELISIRFSSLILLKIITMKLTIYIINNYNT